VESINMKVFFSGCAAALVLLVAAGCVSGDRQYKPRDLENLYGVPPTGYEMPRGRFLFELGCEHYNRSQLVHYERDELREFDEAMKCFIFAIRAFDLAMERYPKYKHEEIRDWTKAAFRYLRKMYTERPSEEDRRHPLLEMRGKDGLTYRERLRMEELEAWRLKQQK
jgi:hypothetical protein